LNSEFIAEYLKRLADELGPIIVDDSLRHAKVVCYVMLDEFDLVGCFYFLQGDSFHPFGEVSVMANMSQCPLDIGGLMGPMTFIPHISSRHEEDVG